MRLLWSEGIDVHISRHGIRPLEVEEVIETGYVTRRLRRSRLGLFGQTEAGRYLFVVLHHLDAELYRVVTARDMTDQERRWYFRHR